MQYYASYDEEGKLLAIGVGNCGTVITESQYNSLLSEIMEKASLTEQLCSDKITIEEVPSKYKEELQKRIATIKREQEEDRNKATDDDIITALEEVL